MPNAAAWNAVTDVMSGAAGTGLAMLAARPLLGNAALDVARRAGDALVAREAVADGQRKWMMMPTYAREMPNFSHGTAGVAEYFLARWERTRRAEDLAYARRHADDVLRRGTVAGEDAYWTQAENRVSRGDVAAQSGWMQGAAGVGAMLLRLDAATRGEPPKRAARFPDALA